MEGDELEQKFRKVGYIGDYIGENFIGVIKGDARSLAYSSENHLVLDCPLHLPCCWLVVEGSGQALRWIREMHWKA